MLDGLYNKRFEIQDQFRKIERILMDWTKDERHLLRREISEKIIIIIKM